MKDNKLQAIFINELDISILDKDFYISIMNRILELKKRDEEQNALRS